MIIDQSYYNDADKMMLRAILPAITALVVVDIDAAAAAIYAVRPPVLNCFGILDVIIVAGSIVLPNCEKKK